jgi:hypothetical protein
LKDLLFMTPRYARIAQDVKCGGDPPVAAALWAA